MFASEPARKPRLGGGSSCFPGLSLRGPPVDNREREERITSAGKVGGGFAGSGGGVWVPLLVDISLQEQFLPALLFKKPRYFKEENDRCYFSSSGNLCSAVGGRNDHRQPGCPKYGRGPWFPLPARKCEAALLGQWWPRQGPENLLACPPPLGLGVLLFTNVHP